MTASHSTSSNAAAALSLKLSFLSQFYIQVCILVHDYNLVSLLSNFHTATLSNPKTPSSKKYTFYW